MRTFPSQICFAIDDESKIGEARRAAQQLAVRELDAAAAGRLAIIVTELATNLMRYARNGKLLLQTLSAGDAVCIEVLAIDSGPGMADVERCMRDGYSTAGTAGEGLGAVRRLADEFDIHSLEGEGTLVMARVGAAPPLRFGAVSVPVRGESECGDSWHVESDGDQAAVMVADGLGHGALAAEAARAAIDAFAAAPFDPPAEIMQRAHQAMAGTRGGAAACALLRADGRLSYCGIGNISGTLLAPDQSQGLVSHNGTLGMNPQRRISQFEYLRAPRALLVMHSDGITTRWNLKNRPDVLCRHPATICALLFRDFHRSGDDVTAVVVA